MMQSNSNPNSLPGIVTDQPEIFESEPVESDDTGVNDLDLINDVSDETIALIEVPIKQAFSYFAERENEIAQFYVQRHGEYKISGDQPGEETDIEKYHRLVSEVNELLNKFQADKSSKLSESTVAPGLDKTALTSNLEILSRQLKALEFAAEDDSLNPTQSEFQNIKSKLDKFGKKILEETETRVGQREAQYVDEKAKVIRMSALERRLNLLETLLGNDDAREQSILKTTKGDNLIGAIDILSSWLSLNKPDSVQRVGKEIDYWTQRLEKINDSISNTSEVDKLDPQAKSKLDQLFTMATNTDKYRAMVPTIIHRLNAMEELQQKAAQVVNTVNHLEQVQSQIVESLNTNKDELTSLNKMFAKNIDLIKEFSKDIDSRITKIRDKDQKF